MKKKLVSLLLSGLMASGIFAGASVASAAEEDSHINIAMYLFDNKGMDPGIDWVGWNTTRMGVGETLVTMNENMELVGQLADEWERIDDVTYRFHIRQGVKFSNGDDLTPEIVKASIERVCEMNSRGGDPKIESIEVDGENVIFKTTEPYSAFVTNLSEPMFCIVDTEADMSDFTNKPICTGPYKVVEFVPEEKVEVEANEYYWDGVPEIKYITAKNIGSDTKVDALLSGDLDITQGPAANTISRVEGNEDIDIVTVTGTRESDYEFNTRESSVLHDVNIRRALSCGINREVMAEVVGNGYASPLGTCFPASVGYHSEEANAQAYDPEKAAEYLEEAGYTDTDGDGLVDKDGENLHIRISLSNSANTVVAQVLQDMWKAIGVEVEIELLENVSDIRSSGDFDVIGAGWQSVNAGDGQVFLNNRWSIGGNDNYSGFESEAFQTVLEKLNTAFDHDERVDCFVEAMNVLNDEVPAVFLYANDNVTLVNNKKVANVTIYPIDYYFVNGKWTLAE